MSNSDHGTRTWARGSAIGAMVLTLFGALWFFAGLATWEDLRRWWFWLAGILPVGLLGIAVWRLWSAKRLPGSHDPELAAQRGKRVGMIFGIVFGVEGMLIAGTSMALARTGHTRFIPLAVAAIVGLHFLPLAHTFQMPVYYWTGLLMVACVLACLFVPDELTRLRIVCLGTGSVLWGSAAVVLWGYTGNY